MMEIRSCLLLALGLGVATAHAQIYRWVDANGKVHYTDTPPVSRPARVEEMKSDPAPGGAGTAADWQEKERAFRERRAVANEAKAKEEKETAAKRDKACAVARSRIAALDGHRVYRVGKDGERVYMEDSERATAEAQARQDMAENCPR